MVKQAAAFLFHRVPNHTTLCFSNIVGPIEEIGFNGHPLAFIAPSCYGQPHVSIYYIHFIKPKYAFCLISFGYESSMIYIIEMSLVSLNKHNNCVWCRD